MSSHDHRASEAERTIQRKVIQGRSINANERRIVQARLNAIQRRYEGSGIPETAPGTPVRFNANFSDLMDACQSAANPIARPGSQAPQFAQHQADFSSQLRGQWQDSMTKEFNGTGTIGNKWTLTLRLRTKNHVLQNPGGGTVQANLGSSSSQTNSTSQSSSNQTNTGSSTTVNAGGSVSQNSGASASATVPVEGVPVAVGVNQNTSASGNAGVSHTNTNSNQNNSGQSSTQTNSNSTSANTAGAMEQHNYMCDMEARADIEEHAEGGVLAFFASAVEGLAGRPRATVGWTAIGNATYTTLEGSNAGQPGAAH